MNSIKIYFLTLFVVSGFCLSAQKPVEINQTDGSGKKTGKWEARYPSGNVRYTGQFYNDKPIDEFVYYHPTGTIRATNSWSQNGTKAYNKTYSEDGILMAEGIYIDQKKDSIWRIYTDIEGFLFSEETYNNNVLHGLTKIYYPESAQLSETVEYVNGLKQGDWRTYYQNGAIRAEGVFLDDTYEGQITYFHPNGIIQSQGQYHQGVMIGIWRTYDDEGNLVAEEIHKSLNE